MSFIIICESQIKMNFRDKSNMNTSIHLKNDTILSHKATVGPTVAPPRVHNEINCQRCFHIIGDASDSRFEAIVDEIMHFRPPNSAHHNTLNVPMSLQSKPLIGSSIVTF